MWVWWLCLLRRLAAFWGAVKVRWVALLNTSLVARLPSLNSEVCSRRGWWIHGRRVGARKIERCCGVHHSATEVVRCVHELWELLSPQLPRIPVTQRSSVHANGPYIILDSLSSFHESFYIDRAHKSKGERFLSWWDTTRIPSLFWNAGICRSRSLNDHMRPGPYGQKNPIAHKFRHWGTIECNRLSCHWNVRTGAYATSRAKED